jgi:hypothetical protein
MPPAAPEAAASTEAFGDGPSSVSGGGASPRPIRRTERRYTEAPTTAPYTRGRSAELGLRTALEIAESVVTGIQDVMGKSAPLPRAEAAYLLSHVLLAFEPFIERVGQHSAALTPALRSRAARLAGQIDQFQAALGQRVAQGGGGSDPLVTSVAPEPNYASKLLAKAAKTVPPRPPSHRAQLTPLGRCAPCFVGCDRELTESRSFLT